MGSEASVETEVSKMAASKRSSSEVLSFQEIRAVARNSGSS